MVLKSKSRHKPIFKQFIRLRENPQDRTKLLNFKKKKWENLIKYYKKRFKRYEKFKPLDQSRYTVTLHPIKGTSYARRYRDSLQAGKRFRLFYGNMLKSHFKKQLQNFKTIKHKSPKIFLLKQFEKRLDTILYRSKFAATFRHARQMIVHDSILVNGLKIKSTNYKAKSGDLISVQKKAHFLVQNAIKNSKIWPLPAKNLVINYKTLEIFYTNPDPTHHSTDFLFNLNIEKLITSYYYT
jgi:ribosomal protein S4